MLTLGIPGSGTTAVMLGALLGFGVQPGPRLYMTNPEIFWSIIMSMYIGMVILLILNLPLIPYIARILAVPKNYLIPLILFFSVTGIYVMSFNNFDIYLMIGIAVVATFLRLYDFPMPPLILAFVLGGLMEENLRRSLLLSNGSWERGDINARMRSNGLRFRWSVSLRLSLRESSGREELLHCFVLSLLERSPCHSWPLPVCIYYSSSTIILRQ